jgi:disintegrin and metalloproteinase domain-containing protein 10
LEAFIRNLSAADLKNWLVRTDNYIPNYGWLLVGLVFLSIIVGCLCKLSNAQDAKRTGIKA